jgi:hypothetical protein
MSQTFSMKKGREDDRHVTNIIATGIEARVPRNLDVHLVVDDYRTYRHAKLRFSLAPASALFTSLRRDHFFFANVCLQSSEQTDRAHFQVP